MPTKEERTIKIEYCKQEELQGLVDQLVKIGVCSKCIELIKDEFINKRKLMVQEIIDSALKDFKFIK